MEFKMKARCGVTKHLTGRGLKIQQRDRDKLHFEDTIRDRTATGGIVSGHRA